MIEKILKFHQRFYDFDNWSTQIIEHEKSVKKQNNFLKQELDWLSKDVKARRKRNMKKKNSGKRA